MPTRSSGQSQCPVFLQPGSWPSAVPPRTRAGPPTVTAGLSTFPSDLATAAFSVLIENAGFYIFLLFSALRSVPMAVPTHVSLVALIGASSRAHRRSPCVGVAAAAPCWLHPVRSSLSRPPACVWSARGAGAVGSALIPPLPGVSPSLQFLTFSAVIDMSGIWSVVLVCFLLTSFFPSISTFQLDTVYTSI